ncbi:hypothetical protein [Streptomyces sp. H39-S7]|uniref:hypothetical protein n=1 Tax=Streptomyces sp. H39-S7 TaxID=3004357 RepID=UPI0022AFC047|nr:hypothetical protein [Streptomyces sp. H39-S7]MCZ4126184.1 hypothetical protein [Streptomyces sp. H39-S7]
MNDRFSLLISTVAVLVSLMLLTAAIQGALAGESVWWIAWAFVLQITTIWQLAREGLRYRKGRQNG